MFDSLAFKQLTFNDNVFRERCTRILDPVDQLLNSDGIIKRSIEGAETRVKSLDERYGRMEISIERNIQRYRAQFSQLDVMVAQMNSMSDYLGQQFEMMNAQLGRD